MKIIYKLLPLYFLFSIFILPQKQIDDDQIDNLFDQVYQLESIKDHIGVVKTLIKILNIDSTNQRAQNQISAALRSYFKEIVNDEVLLSDVLGYIKNPSKIPIIPLLAHYYSINDIDEVQKILSLLPSINSSNLYLSVEPLFAVNQESNPTLFREILYIIRPYAAIKNQSEFVFLNYLLEPAQSLTPLLFELNIRMDNLKLCNDSLEINRLKELYFITNPNPRSNLFKEIENNLSDCLALQNPVLLAIYYYKNGLFFELNKLEVNTLTVDKNLKVNYRDLLYIDTSINSAEAKKLVKLLIQHLPTDIIYGAYNDIELFKLALIFRFIGLENKAQEFLRYTDVQKVTLFALYEKKVFSELDFLLNQKEVDPKYFEIDTDELINFNILIDSVRALKLFSFISNNIQQKNISDYEDEFLYEFVKVCHSLNIETEKYFIELVQRIIPSGANYKRMAIWGISCILTRDEDRAERLFNLVENFGTNSDRDYLMKELKWWNRAGLTSKVLDNSLSRLDNTYKGTNNSVVKTITDTTSFESISAENYFALLIGVESYNDKEMNLRFPLKDLKRLKEVLLNDYLFLDKNIITLSNPERNNIFETFQNLKKKLTGKDNILIFYAGHGFWDESMQQGYWLPSNAVRLDPTNWISNSEIVDLLKGIKAKHTLLIADACFSGSIFVTRQAFYKNDKSIKIAYSKISKKGMTSGANTPVPDKSIFVDFLIKRLQENSEKYLLAEKLYLGFRDAVTNNSLTPQRPLYGELDGDEGGEFIFIKK